MYTPPHQGPDVPQSPNELKGGVRGPIRGVTRIGPRAFGLAFFIICGLLVAILFGLNRGSAYSKAPQAQALNPLPPAPSDNADRFGANEPLVVPSAIAQTAPPPLVLAATPAPSLEQAGVRHAPAMAPTQAQPSYAAAANSYNGQAQAAEQGRAEAERVRRERMEAALRSPIISAATTDRAADPSQRSIAFAGSDPASSSANRPVRFASNNADQPADGQPPTGAGDAAGQNTVGPANVTLPAGGNPKDFLQAQRFAPISPYEILATSVIPAALITSIDSTLAGQLSAQVREDVYDTKTGRYLLIPKGSRLVGNYRDDVKYGQSRLGVAWTRLIFPDTTSIDLQDMSGADVEGGAGVAGKVDNHYGRVFGAAILTSILAAGVQLAQPQNSSILTSPSAGQQLGQSVGTQIANTGTAILQKNLNIPPTLHIPKGYPFLVVVDRDIVLPGPYGKGQ